GGQRGAQVEAIAVIPLEAPLQEVADDVIGDKARQRAIGTPAHVARDQYLEAVSGQQLNQLQTVQSGEQADALVFADGVLRDDVLEAPAVPYTDCHQAQARIGGECLFLFRRQLRQAALVAVDNGEQLGQAKIQD